MINGAHVIILSKEPEADRAFFRDVLGLSHVDVGGGWLIFGLPPAEVAVHPSERESVHEFYLMCQDVNALVTALSERGIACGPVEDQGWGLLTSITLPGGGTLSAYEPRHPRPSNGKAPSRTSAGRGAPQKSVPKRRVPKKKAAPKKPAPKKVVRKAAPKKAAKRVVGPKRRKSRTLGRNSRAFRD